MGEEDSARFLDYFAVCLARIPGIFVNNPPPKPLRPSLAVPNEGVAFFPLNHFPPSGSVGLLEFSYGASGIEGLGAEMLREDGNGEMVCYFIEHAWTDFEKRYHINVKEGFGKFLPDRTAPPRRVGARRVIGSRRVTGRKRFASLGRGGTTPNLSTGGDNPAKMSPVSSRIHCLISSGA